jgi:hypothetical protein
VTRLAFKRILIHYANSSTNIARERENKRKPRRTLKK